MTTETSAESLGSAVDWPAAPISRARLRVREEHATRLDDIDVTKPERSVRLVIVEAGVNAIDLRGAVEGSSEDAVVLGQARDETPGSFAVRVLRRLDGLHQESKIDRADVLVGPKSGRALRQARMLLARVLTCDLAVSDLVFRADGEAEPAVHDELIELVETMLRSPSCRSQRISIRVSGVSNRAATQEML